MASTWFFASGDIDCKPSLDRVDPFLFNHIVVQMGHRHMAFVIARVRPYSVSERAYRCVAAFYHQWCFGTGPLRAVRRFVSMVKQKETGDVVRAELRAIDGLYGPQGMEPMCPQRPCPFILTLLCQAYVSSPDEPGDIGVDIQHLYNSDVGAETFPWDHGESVRVHLHTHLTFPPNRLLW